VEYRRKHCKKLPEGARKTQCIAKARKDFNNCKPSKNGKRSGVELEYEVGGRESAFTFGSVAKVMMLCAAAGVVGFGVSKFTHKN